MACEYADAIQAKSCKGLDNCVGFWDSQAVEIGRPRDYMEQMVCYNGYYGHHCLRFQAIHCPGGLCHDLYGPVEGRRSDNYLLNAFTVL